MRTLMAAAVLAGLAYLPVVANATPVTETYDFSATFAPDAPYLTLSGSATVTFDPGVDENSPAGRSRPIYRRVTTRSPLDIIPLTIRSSSGIGATS